MENHNNQIALGMVETYGYIAHIEAADACLKAANVRLIGSERVKGGYMLIKIMGDVGSVKAAIDAARAAIEILGLKAVPHVIPRPSQEIQKLIFAQKSEISGKSQYRDSLNRDKQDTEDEHVKEETLGGINDNLREEILMQENHCNNNTTTVIKQGFEIEELLKMNVAKLRVIARSLKGISMDKNKINFGKKEELIKAILDCFQRREE